MEEFNFINKYLVKLIKNNTYAKKLNDDVFFDKKNNLVLSVDTYNEGVHFIDFDNPKKLIKKIVRSSISDLICKGVKPKYYFISASGDKRLFSKFKIKTLINSLESEQRKFKIKISGGDTCKSKIISFTIISIGYSKKIIERNKTKLNDDIYLTGNVGDSFLGLKLIKKKTTIDKKLRQYFINKFYCPEIPYKSYKTIRKFANSSIDISDGLIDDLKKLINRQNVSFKVDIDKIPISKQLFKYLILYKKKKIDYVYHGDDYQILFTAKKRDRNKILKNFNLMNQKVSLIGEILPKKAKNLLYSDKKVFKLTKYKGYSHKF